MVGLGLVVLDRVGLDCIALHCIFLKIFSCMFWQVHYSDSGEKHIMRLSQERHISMPREYAGGHVMCYSSVIVHYCTVHVMRYSSVMMHCRTKHTHTTNMANATGGCVRVCVFFTAIPIQKKATPGTYFWHQQY